MSIGPPDMARYLAAVAATPTLRLTGQVTDIIGLLIEAQGPHTQLGDLCYIRRRQGDGEIPAEVVGFRQHRVLLMPLADTSGISPGCEVIAAQQPLGVAVGPRMLGRVIDGLGRPLDGKGPLVAEERYPLHTSPPSPLSRRRISTMLPVGVKAIDGLLTCGCGQRIGIMAGSGVGKSTLLGMITRNTEADMAVVALVGERGREVKDFIERDLGEAGLQRAVVVVATSDQPALVRIKAAFTATAVAEYFRDLGKNVILLMDSLTRFAMAQREVGLSIGEPPTTRGYTPSVFAMLPQLLERVGTGPTGSITGMYTVLVEGDDLNEPVADAVRSILDGHIVLSRQLAAQGHYPAIDISVSVSRVMPDVVTSDHRRAAQNLRALLATYHSAEDLINLGAYSTGSNPQIDRAIAAIDSIRAFLRQDIYESCPAETTIQQLVAQFG